jgi:acid phosphatase
MKKRYRNLLLIFWGIWLLAAEAYAGDNLNSTLWTQTAAEYKVVAMQTYQFAARQLDLALRVASWTAALEQTDDYQDLMPAVILDIDETVLDNSAFQVQLLRDGNTYDPGLWDEWISKAEALAVPGALDFVKYTKNKGVAILYITNRTCRQRANNPDVCPQKRETVENLRQLGFPELDQHDRILLRKDRDDWTSEKKSRRLEVVKTYRILLMFGDDLGDFLPNVKNHISPDKRVQVALRNQKRWGVQWFMLPNPMYGSWLRVLGGMPMTHLKGINF